MNYTIIQTTEQCFFQLEKANFTINQLYIFILVCAFFELYYTDWRKVKENFNKIISFIKKFDM